MKSGLSAVRVFFLLLVISTQISSNFLVYAQSLPDGTPQSPSDRSADASGIVSDASEETGILQAPGDTVEPGPETSDIPEVTDSSGSPADAEDTEPIIDVSQAKIIDREDAANNSAGSNDASPVQGDMPGAPKDDNITSLKTAIIIIPASLQVAGPANDSASPGVENTGVIIADDNTSGPILSPDNTTIDTSNQTVVYNNDTSPPSSMQLAAIVPQSVCGDRICDGNETVTSCPADCRPRTIIVRSNDLAAWWSTDSAIYVTDYIRNMSVPQTLAVIPTVSEWKYELGSDRRLTDYLISIRTDPKIEIAQHGMYHTYREFEGLSQEEAETKLLEGKTMFKNTIYVDPVTFVPPNFGYDFNALNASKNQGFQYFSAGWNAIDNGHAFRQYPEGLENIPATTDFYDWGAGRFYTPQEIETSCENAMDTFGTCNLLLLHYTFQDSTGKVDPDKIKILEEVMQWVKTKESEGVRLKTIGSHKNLPLPAPKEKFIVFRSDDIAAWWSDETAINITETLRQKNIPQVLSIIPGNQYGGKISDDPTITGYLQGIKNDNTVEFALHGYDHRIGEFRDIAYSDAVSKISDGSSIINTVIGFRPVSFVSPYNEYNNNTIDALVSMNLSIISSGYDDVGRGLAFKRYEGILHLPQTTDIYSWSESRMLNQSEISNSCENAMDKYDVCVIVIHHALFRDSLGHPDPDKLGALTDIVDWAKEKESSGQAKIVRLKDVTLAASS